MDHQNKETIWSIKEMKPWTSVSIAQNINFWTIDSPNFIMFIYIICFDDWSNNFIKPMLALNHVILFWSCIFSSIYGTWSKRTHLHFMKFWSKGTHICSKRTHFQKWPLIFGQNGPTYFWRISRVRIVPIIYNLKKLLYKQARIQLLLLRGGAGI